MYLKYQMKTAYMCKLYLMPVLPIEHSVLEAVYYRLPELLLGKVFTVAIY